MNNSSSGTTVPEQSLYGYPLIWAVVSLILFSIVSDILTIFIIKRTRTLKSYTGDLLISQVSSCIPRQLLFLILIFSYRKVHEDVTLQAARYSLRLLLTGFQGITSYTLAAISLNLYFAICHSTLYRNRMSRVYVLVFIPMCWIVNLSVGLCTLASKDPLFVSGWIIHPPSYEGSAFWAWLFIVFFIYIMPAVVTAFTFIMILSHSRKVRPLSFVNVEFRDKYLLVKVVVGLAICYISLWSLMHLFRAMQYKYEPEEGVKTTFSQLAAIPYFLNLVYDAFKLGVYLLTYRPIRLTVIELCRKKRRGLQRSTNVQVLPKPDTLTSQA